MNEGPIPIGEAAKRSGLSVPTLRYYEDIGLLRPAGRRDGGHRIYAVADLRRLKFIAGCRDMGFTIEQIRRLVSVTVDNRPCAEARGVAQAHLATVRTKIAELGRIRRHLEAFVDGCSVAECAGGAASGCGPLVTLARKSPERRSRRRG